MDFTKKSQVSDQMISELRRRIGDYSKHDFVKDREELVNLWKANHPNCVNEAPSLKHHILDKLCDGIIDNQEKPEQWSNDIYFVNLRRWSKDNVFGSSGGMIQLGINTHDGTARHDWREFQMIKNQLCGPECEAFELYPAESRLLDPSNYYTLWCFPGLKHIRVGLKERRVLDANEAFAPQRAFEK